MLDDSGTINKLIVFQTEVTELKREKYIMFYIVCVNGWNRGCHVSLFAGILCQCDLCCCVLLGIYD